MSFQKEKRSKRSGETLLDELYRGHRSLLWKMLLPSANQFFNAYLGIGTYRDVFSYMTKGWDRNDVACYYSVYLERKYKRGGYRQW